MICQFFQRFEYRRNCRPTSFPIIPEDSRSGRVSQNNGTDFLSNFSNRKTGFSHYNGFLFFFSGFGRNLFWKFTHHELRLIVKIFQRLQTRFCGRHCWDFYAAHTASHRWNIYSSCYMIYIGDTVTHCM